MHLVRLRQRGRSRSAGWWQTRSRMARGLNPSH